MSAARKMTLAEWYALDEDDPRELVSGVLEETEVPERIHELVVAWLVTLLGPWAMKHGGGYAFASGLKLAVRKDTGRMPDVVCYTRGRKPNAGLVRTPPDVVVEVISPRPRDARRDRIAKSADYAAFGVTQYWLVDPRLRTFEIFQLDKKRRYTCIAAAAAGKLRRIPRLPGLVIDLDMLWARIDELEE